MKRPHYAWLICLGGALCIFCVVGLGINVFSIYQPHIIALNNFSNAQGSLITTTRATCNLVTLMTVNRLCARFGPRRVMTFGVLLTGLSCLLFSMATSFPMYCAAAAFTGAGMCYGGMVPLSIMMTQWFQDRRGFALGLASAGSGLATIFAPGIITGLIEGRSMQFAFLCEAAFLAAIALLAGLLLRDNPGKLNMEPYRVEGGERKKQTVRTATPRETATRFIPFMVITAVFIGAPSGPGLTHLTVLFTKEGFDSATVSSLISYLGMVLCVSKILCGQVFDRLGGWLGNFYIFTVFTTGVFMCCLAFTGSVPLAFLAITTFALGLPIATLSPSIWGFDLASEADYAKVVRAISLSYSVGGLVFGPVPGILADHFDSYVPAYFLFGVIMLASMFAVQLIYHLAGVGKRR